MGYLDYPGLQRYHGKVQEEIDELKDDLEQLQEEIDEFSGGITPAIKEALLNCFAHVGWDHDSDKSYYDALEEALYVDEINHITAVFTPGTHKVYPTDSIESLRHFLVVTVTYNDQTQAVVEDYTLQGNISTTGTQTITVKYGRNKTTTFTVTVETNSTGILYEWDFTKGLTDLRQNKTALLGGANTPASISASGVAFSAEAQWCELFDMSESFNSKMFGKTIQVDVASFSPARTDGHVRFIMTADTTTNGVEDRRSYNSGLLWRFNVYPGWSIYSGTAWPSSSPYIFTGMSAANAISGHTIGLYINTSGYCKMYVDGTSKGTLQNNITKQLNGLLIGGTQLNANNCFFYNALVTGIRIYNGEVA